MLISGAFSLISISIITFLLSIYSLVSEGKLDIYNLIDSMSSFLFGMILIFVPINMSCLLIIHFIGLFRYIMYSIKMVVLESLLLLMVSIIVYMIIWNMNIHGIYVKSELLISVIAEFYFAFVVKKIFYKRYLHFQKKIEDCYIKPNIEKRVDIIMTVIMNIIILIPGLLFIFIFF